MMKQKKDQLLTTWFHSNIIYRFCILVAFAGVIFLPAIAFKGTLAGLRLWAVVVLPGLFPALIITTCILALFPMNRAISYIYIMAAGVFCGFPIGSILCGQLHRSNKQETVCDKIMAFCNLSSPSFVMNYIVYSSIAGRYPMMPILLCIYLPVIEVYAYVLLRYRKDIFLSKTSDSVHSKVSRSEMIQIFDNSIQSAIKSMLKLGGYIVVFSCLAAYIYEIPFGNETVSAVICGISEITNGIYLCSKLSIDIRSIVLLIVAINALGGCSTLMQTAGMTTGTGVSIKKYIYHKLAFTAITIVNALVIIYVL